MSGVGAEPRPPRLGGSSQAKVIGEAPLRLTVASLRNGVTPVTSASKTISRLRIDGSSPDGVVIATSSSAGLQTAQDLHRLGGLRPSRVVGVGVDRADDALPVDDEASRHRQAPGAVPIAPGQVDAELGV